MAHNLISEIREFQQSIKERKSIHRKQEDEATEINDWREADTNQIKAVIYQYVAMKLDKILSVYELEDK